MRSAFRFLVVPLAVLAAALSTSDAARAQFEPTVGTTSSYCVPWTLSFGAAPASGTIGAPGETDCWRFSGAAGDRIRVRAVRTSGSVAPQVEIASSACPAAAAAEVTCTLATGGSVIVLARDAARSQTGNYAISVQRLNDPVGCSALAFDASTRTGAIVAGETECWRFTGAAGDRVRLRLVTPAATLSPRAEVLAPDGTTRCAPNGAENHTCVLDASGTHTILVRDAAANVGGYSLAVQRLNDPVGCTLKPYATTAAVGVVTTTGETDCWRFGATAGQRVRIRAVNTSGALDPAVEVLRPSGTTRCNATTTDDVTCQLDITGTHIDGMHTILVKSEAERSSGGYRIAAITLNDGYYNCPNLATSPSAHSASIIYGAEIDCYTSWAPESGNRELRVEATSGMLDPVVEVLRPDGTPRCVRANPDGWFDCYGEQYEYQRILVYDASGTNAGNYEIDRR